MPEIVSTQLGYKYFTRSTDKVLLYTDGRICIRPNVKQKKPPLWLSFPNLGLATIAFNKMFKDAQESSDTSRGVLSTEKQAA